MIFGRSRKKIFWKIFFSGCDSMDVGRSGEVQGVVGRVWVCEILGFFDGYSIFLKKSQKIGDKKSFLAVNRSPDVGI